MHRIFLCVAAMFVAASCASAQSASQACQVSALPDGVRAALAAQYEDWRVETLADLADDYRTAWTKKDASACPGIVPGRFEDKNELSYALLLIPREKGKDGYRFVVFSRKSDKDSFRATVLESDDKYAAASCAIHHLDPGPEFNEEKFSAFKLKTEGIYLEFFEASSFIYFWKRGHYQHVTESD
jgi:hypothetical protein